MYKFSDEVNVDSEGREIRKHGDLDYPVACYYNDMNKDLVIWHWHEEFELIIVKRGSVKISVGSVEEILKEGDGCFINSNVAHSVLKVDEQQEGIINSIVFHAKLIGGRHSIYWKKYLKPLIDSKKRQFMIFKSTEDKEITQLIQTAWQTEAEEKSGFEFEVRNFLSRIIFLISEGECKKDYIPTVREIRDMERTKAMITFIENHFKDEVSLSQISRVVAVSEGECLRCFKRVTGITPIRFMKEYRLIRAAEQIRTTRQNISEIAEDCGFLDMSYFAKSFKAIFKESPTEYRNANI